MFVILDYWHNQQLIIGLDDPKQLGNVNYASATDM